MVIAAFWALKRSKWDCLFVPDTQRPTGPCFLFLPKLHSGLINVYFRHFQNKLNFDAHSPGCGLLLNCCDIIYNLAKVSGNPRPLISLHVCGWSVCLPTLCCVCVRVKGIFGEWSVKKDTLGRKLTGLELNLWRRYFECCKITGGVEAFSITNPLGIQMLWIYGTYVRLANVARNLIMCGL